MMKPSQKALSDLSRTSLNKADIDHFIGFLPLSLRDEISLAFEDRHRDDPELAKVWLVATASVFLKDYNGSPLTRDEWEELRDMAAEFSGELDMDLITYIMGLVVENGAL